MYLEKKVISMLKNYFFFDPGISVAEVNSFGLHIYLLSKL